MASGRKGSGPHGSFAAGLGQKHIGVKIDRRTVDELYRMLRTEGITLKTFLELCIDRYVRSDPSMRAIVESYRRNTEVSQEERKRGLALTKRERDEILDALEIESPFSDEEVE